MISHNEGILEGCMSASVPLMLAVFAWSKPYFRDLHLPELALAVAILGLFYRSGWDLERERLIRWQSLLSWKFSRRSVVLPSVGKVSLKPRRYVYRGKQSNHVGEDFELFLGDLRLCALTDYFSARGLGERVAKFLQISFEDLTCDPPKLRRWEDLDSALRHQVVGQVSSIGPGFPVPRPPDHLRANYREQGDHSLRVDIPNGKLPFPWLHLLLMVAGLTLLAWGWLDLRKGRPFEFVGCLLACWSAWKASGKFQAEQVATSPQGLHFRSQWSLWKTLPWSQIEEIEIEPMKGRGHDLGQAGVQAVLCARTDRKGFLIGRHLPPEELVYLRDLLLYHCSGLSQ